MPASSRAVSPVVGVVLLTALTVALAGSLAAATLAVSPPSTAGPTMLSVTADASGRIELVHEGGAPLAVAQLRVHIAVDGTPLRYQPPVPFVGARGFRGAPAGPFNSVADGRWTAGEAAALVVAATNRPTLSRGSTLTVTVYENGRQVVDVETTVHPVDRTPAEAFGRGGEHRRRGTVGGIRPRLRASRSRRPSRRGPCRRRERVRWS